MFEESFKFYRFNDDSYVPKDNSKTLNAKNKLKKLKALKRFGLLSIYLSGDLNREIIGGRLSSLNLLECDADYVNYLLEMKDSELKPNSSVIKEYKELRKMLLGEFKGDKVGDFGDDINMDFTLDYSEFIPYHWINVFLKEFEDKKPKEVINCIEDYCLPKFSENIYLKLSSQQRQNIRKYISNLANAKNNSYIPNVVNNTILKEEDIETLKMMSSSNLDRFPFLKKILSSEDFNETYIAHINNNHFFTINIKKDGNNLIISPINSADGSKIQSFNYVYQLSEIIIPYILKVKKCENIKNICVCPMKSAVETSNNDCFIESIANAICAENVESLDLYNAFVANTKPENKHKFDSLYNHSKSFHNKPNNTQQRPFSTFSNIFYKVNKEFEQNVINYRKLHTEKLKEKNIDFDSLNKEKHILSDSKNTNNKVVNSIIDNNVNSNNKENVSNVKSNENDSTIARKYIQDLWLESAQRNGYWNSQNNNTKSNNQEQSHLSPVHIINPKKVSNNVDIKKNFNNKSNQQKNNKNKKGYTSSKTYNVKKNAIEKNNNKQYGFLSKYKSSQIDFKKKQHRKNNRNSKNKGYNNFII